MLACLNSYTRAYGLAGAQVQLQAAMDEMDDDNSGEVDFDEFRKWWKETGSQNAGIFGGLFSVFSVSTLRKRRAQEAGLTREEHAQARRDEAHASLLEQKQAADQIQHEKHMTHIEDARKHADAARRIMLGDDAGDGLGAETFGSDHVRAVSYTGGHGIKVPQQQQPPCRSLQPQPNTPSRGLHRSE